MANNLGYTPGTGAQITTDQNSGDSSHAQVVKLAISGAGLGTLIPATSGNGLLVNVSQVQGVVVVNNPTAANLKVDASGANVPVVNASATTLAISAPQASPAFVRLSDGTNPIATLPVSGTFWQTTQPVSGTFWQATQPVSGTVAATQSGTWNVGVVTTITNTVTVSGTVTDNQGAPASLANGWPVKLTDGTSSVGVSTVGGSKALKVDVISSVGAGAQVDSSAFTVGSGGFDVGGGLYNDAAASPTAGQAAAARITAFRALHVNLRNNAGTELGTSGAPVRTDPTGTTTQPVSGTVAATLSYTAAAPLPVTPAPNPGTNWRAHVAYGASASAVAVHTPASGKTVYVKGITITPTTGGAAVTLFDNTDSASSELYNGQPPVGCHSVVFATGEPLAAANNILRYSTGVGVAGDFVVWGYDA